MFESPFEAARAIQEHQQQHMLAVIGGCFSRVCVLCQLSILVALLGCDIVSSGTADSADAPDTAAAAAAALQVVGSEAVCSRADASRDRRKPHIVEADRAAAQLLRRAAAAGEAGCCCCCCCCWGIEDLGPWTAGTAVVICAAV